MDYIHFILPLAWFFIEIKYSGIFVCEVAIFSAIQEGYFIRVGRIGND